MKKALKALTVAVLLVAGVVALPLTAQASRRVNRSTVTVNNNNSAFVMSNTKAVSYTGGNVQKFSDDDNTITTGSATSTAQSSNVVNTNVVVVAVGQSN